MNKVLRGVSVFAMIFSTLFVSSGFAAETESTAPQIATSATPAAPKYFLTYSYYKYDLQGTNSANTRIYQFGSSTVDLQMVTATYLYSPNWTLLAFVPYVKNMVETTYFPGTTNFKTRDYTEGLG
ncbi:MAG TPA: acid shock protein, partial [Bdellovibrio sp.]|nr:acid shock protein [Bdellovibrio sp.]